MLLLILRTLPLTSRILLVRKEIQARRQAGVEAVEGRGYEPCESASHIGVRPYIIAYNYTDEDEKKWDKFFEEMYGSDLKQ